MAWAILFLDFDGVLHPLGPGAEGRYFCRRPMLEATLARAEFAEIDIVISSAWRSAFPLKRLKRLFSPELRSRVVERTPTIREIHGGRQLRGREIAEWLARHPAVKEWFALDDDQDGFTEEQRSRVVFTNPGVGLTPADLHALKHLLRARCRLSRTPNE